MPISSLIRAGGIALVALAACLLGSCRSETDRPVIVDLIGAEADILRPQPGQIAIASRTVLAATAQGLLTFDAQGEIIGGVAESWIVADNGQSYIFRLKRLNWADGKPVRADEVASILQARLRAVPDMLGGISAQVRAMTDSVIEIRIDTPVPSFIQLLASQRLPILKAAPFVGTGPYGASIRLGRAYLTPLPDPLASPDDLADPERDRDRRTLEAARAALAIARFKQGRADLVLGGRYQDLPLVTVSDLPPSTIKADPVGGIFGLQMRGDTALLGDAKVRAAINAAIDREGLAAAFNLSGWTIAEGPMPARLDLASAPIRPTWAGQDIESRRSDARAAIAEWTAKHGTPPVLRLALPPSTGSRLLYSRIAADFAAIGLRLSIQSDSRNADFILIDEVAPFDSAHWYLSRLACASGPGCDAAAATRLAEARAADDATTRTHLLGEAEKIILAQNNFMPLGMPIRWSLVSRRLTAFQPSPRAVHPLNRLLPIPN